MQMGSGDLGRPRRPFELPVDMDDRVRASVARDNIPTLAEVKAAVPMVGLSDGGLVPGGWPVLADPDTDRDSGEAAELADLVRHMDVMCEHIVVVHIPGAALKLATQWQKIRKITQSNQPKADGS